MERSGIHIEDRIVRVPAQAGAPSVDGEDFRIWRTLCKPHLTSSIDEYAP